MFDVINVLSKSDVLVICINSNIAQDANIDSGEERGARIRTCSFIGKTIDFAFFISSY